VPARFTSAQRFMGVFMLQVYYFATGQIYEGLWEAGKKSGWCVYTVETGTQWAGAFMPDPHEPFLPTHNSSTSSQCMLSPSYRGLASQSNSWKSGIASVCNHSSTVSLECHGWSYETNVVPQADTVSSCNVFHRFLIVPCAISSISSSSMV
jgi:hypothetical protein